jgi:hypothetical protein
MCYELNVEVDQIWLYQPDNSGHMPVLQGPAIDGPRTGARLQPGEKFYVSEIRTLQDTPILFLKLADGRGWVYDQLPTDQGFFGEGEMLCKRIVEETWVYQPANGAPMAIRRSPEIDGERTDHRVHSGDEFVVDEIMDSGSGVLFLKLQDGRGWLFDKHPEYGDLCDRIY